MGVSSFGSGDTSIRRKSQYRKSGAFYFIVSGSMMVAIGTCLIYSIVFMLWQTPSELTMSSMLSAFAVGLVSGLVSTTISWCQWK
jgi:hypothetical protein